MCISFNLHVILLYYTFPATAVYKHPDLQGLSCSNSLNLFCKAGSSYQAVLQLTAPDSTYQAVLGVLSVGGWASKFCHYKNKRCDSMPSKTSKCWNVQKLAKTLCNFQSGYILN